MLYAICYMQLKTCLWKETRTEIQSMVCTPIKFSHREGMLPISKSKLSSSEKNTHRVNKNQPFETHMQGDYCYYERWENMYCCTTTRRESF